ncbi:MAG: DUF6092 family protein [Bacillota bacterium]
MREEWHSILAFMIASAMGCVNEPPIYGPLRLIESMEKLIGFASDNGLEQDERLLDVMHRIQEDKSLCMYDEEAFSALLQEIGLCVTELMAN